MKKKYFEVELLSDVVITERSATEGGHRSLDYLPGSVFLGVAAKRMYDDLSKDESYSLFHSGKMRFGNAYPVVEHGV